MRLIKSWRPNSKSIKVAATKSKVLINESVNINNKYKAYKNLQITKNK